MSETAGGKCSPRPPAAGLCLRGQPSAGIFRTRQAGPDDIRGILGGALHVYMEPVYWIAADNIVHILLLPTFPDGKMSKENSREVKQLLFGVAMYDDHSQNRIVCTTLSVHIIKKKVHTLQPFIFVIFFHTALLTLKVLSQFVLNLYNFNCHEQ